MVSSQLIFANTPVPAAHGLPHCVCDIIPCCGRNRFQPGVWPRHRLMPCLIVLRPMGMVRQHPFPLHRLPWLPAALWVVYGTTVANSCTAAVGDTHTFTAGRDSMWSFGCRVLVSLERLLFSMGLLWHNGRVLWSRMPGTLRGMLPVIPFNTPKPVVLLNIPTYFV